MSIPKKGLPSLLNFRPISVIGVIRKIFEKVIRNLLFRRIHQQSFIAGPAVDAIVDSIAGQVDTIYMDFLRAFHKLPYYLFLEKRTACELPHTLAKIIPLAN